MPAAYLDFGFAGNGDLIVVATDDITDAKLELWIARYSPDGRRISKKAVDRRIPQHAGDWIDVDPTNDTVVISERDAGTTTFTGRRISSATGKTTRSIDLHAEVRRIAIDGAGRMFAIAPLYSYFNERTCTIDRLNAGGGIAQGVDHWLETCRERFVDTGPPVLGDPVAIEIGRDGRVLIVDAAPAGRREHAPEAGLALTTLTTGFGFVRQWHLPLEWAPGAVPFASWSQSLTLAGASDGGVYVGETIISDDGTRSTGFRVRAFDKVGALLATYGVGGDQAGVTWPSYPNVDADGRLWVIDLDTVTRTYSIKVLE